MTEIEWLKKEIAELERQLQELLTSTHYWTVLLRGQITDKKKRLEELENPPKEEVIKS